MSASDSALALTLLCVLVANTSGNIETQVAFRIVGTFWLAIHLYRKWKEGK